MNTKSILGILLLILALSLTLGSVSAEEITSDDASADVLSVEETAVEEVSSDTGNAAGEPVTANVTADTSKADLAVDVTPLQQVGDMNTWSVVVYNYGPDVAKNTIVALGSDNLAYYDHIAFSGQFDPETGIWYVGDLAKGAYTELVLAMYKVAPGPAFIEAAAVSDTFDPDLSNNYDIAYIDVESASASEETLPATGNPLAMALLALLVVGVGGLKRKL
ncbi:MAG: DUF11 domain-containing protein [Methanobrevibacter sp.]|uniref:DUF11 domain-containing protein n=1 Tax=Methanobrevibacter sp. TaxID=66852 RepID=UPI0025E40284|nr:DUF11 domain-containing protein [Methanobrevibacter sp.]MBR0271398.1 DUF11 domain-containing protein [Methanobrevibacter sp.]